MYKYEYKCPKCKRIYKSNQEPQQIFICDCGKVDIPLYSINLRYCYPTLIETLMNKKPNKKLLRYNNDEYVYNYVLSDDGHITIGCYRVSKIEPWRLTDKEMRIRDDLAKGKSSRWSLSLQDVIITDEVFSERRKRVKEL